MVPEQQPKTGSDVSRVKIVHAIHPKQGESGSSGGGSSAHNVSKALRVTDSVKSTWFVLSDGVPNHNTWRCCGLGFLLGGRVRYWLFSAVFRKQQRSQNMKGDDRMICAGFSGGNAVAESNVAALLGRSLGRELIAIPNPLG